MMNSFVIPTCLHTTQFSNAYIEEMYILINFENLKIYQLHFKVNNQCYKQCDVEVIL